MEERGGEGRLAPIGAHVAREARWVTRRSLVSSGAASAGASKEVSLLLHRLAV